MNVKRFFGRTNRDAMAKLRAELGSDAIVLKNRAVDGGVEILAMCDDASQFADYDGAQASLASHEARDAHNSHDSHDAVDARHAAPARGRTLERERAVSGRTSSGPRADKPAPAAPVPEMSTVSFQQYVRDRLAQKAAPAPTLDEVLNETKGSPPSGVPRGRAEVRAAAGERRDVPAPALDELLGDQHAAASHGASQRPGPGARPEQTDAAQIRAQAEAQARMLAELREMRSFITGQLSSLAWYDGARRSPLQARLLRQMLAAGFSPMLTRAVVSKLPSDFGEEQALQWARRALEQNLHCASGTELFDRGGIFALVGPTGVGKTTSTAKIAARFALKHGAQSVGLVSVDAYRIGGQDQLRSFGRLLGVPVHVAHDAATLADFLHLYMNKKLVLIDTAGIGQRDERVDELLASLASSVVRKLVVLNAASQAETLDDVITAYRASQAAGVVISKVDEAVKLGGVLDCAIRHRLELVGVANGQRVPEDWIAPDPRQLIDAALSAKPSAAFDLAEGEVGVMFQPDPPSALAGIGGLNA